MGLRLFKGRLFKGRLFRPRLWRGAAASTPTEPQLGPYGFWWSFPKGKEPREYRHSDTTTIPPLASKSKVRTEKHCRSTGKLAIEDQSRTRFVKAIDATTRKQQVASLKEAALTLYQVGEIDEAAALALGALVAEYEYR